jgi:hypothetical protein
MTMAKSMRYLQAGTLSKATGHPSTAYQHALRRRIAIPIQGLALVVLDDDIGKPLARM